MLSRAQFQHSFGFQSNPGQIDTQAADSLLGNNMGRTRAGSVRLANVYDSGTKILESQAGPRYPQYGVAEGNGVNWYGSRRALTHIHPALQKARGEAITGMLGGVKDG